VDSESFQKELARIQIGATAAVAIGAVIIALGATIMTLSSGIELPDELQTQFDILTKFVLYLGLVILFGGLIAAHLRLRKAKLDKPDDKNPT